MEICKLAVETCYWPLFEVINGEWKLNYRPKKKLPIEEFLKKQGRFKHLFKPENRHNHRQNPSKCRFKMGKTTKEMWRRAR